MKITDIAFKLNRLETFIYTFENGINKYEEYIHCVISEHVELNRDGEPEIIKIKQIPNLKDYLDKKDVVFSERTFRVSELKPFPQFKKSI
jgi:hypothetical protein